MFMRKNIWKIWHVQRNAFQQVDLTVLPANRSFLISVLVALWIWTATASHMQQDCSGLWKESNNVKEKSFPMKGLNPQAAQSQFTCRGGVQSVRIRYVGRRILAITIWFWRVKCFYRSKSLQVFPLKALSSCHVSGLQSRPLSQNVFLGNLAHSYIFLLFLRCFLQVT